ncbi:DNA-binding protein YbaB [Actinoallomurus bryophytorum]|uniref:DNA-binding protein YbaB n=1 Tax=Actinoallomurus bryophytorum TaxID=1490222 RepID=A0A543CGS0_9ACTN|nr:DNA-binding protein YbaB [Actinoallomurus bryophytorum]
MERSVEQAAGMMRPLQEAMDRFAEITGEGEGADGLIHAAVEASGRVKAVTFNPRIKRLDEKALAGEIVAAVQAAQKDAANKRQEMLTEAIGDSIPFAKNFGVDKALEQIQQIEESFSRSMKQHVEELERIQRTFE